MFENDLIDRARANRRHLVLPEGTDERILRATETLLRRGVADLTLLGDPAEITRRAREVGVEIGAARLVDPATAPWRDDFAERYAELRKHKAVTLDLAYDVVRDVNYFGTMMVSAGLADGMVSGAEPHDRRDHPPGIRDHQDRARPVGRVQRLLHAAGRPRAGLRRLRGQPRPGRRPARRHRAVVRADRGGVRHRAAGRHALLLDRQLGLGRRRREGGRRDRPDPRATPRPTRGGSHPVRRGNRPSGGGDQAAGQHRG
nr:hypothetical protein GCM10020092_014040 [Actinoplanes digitatis]